MFLWQIDDDWDDSPHSFDEDYCDECGGPCNYAEVDDETEPEG